MSTLSAQVSLELREFTAKEKSEPTPTEVEDHHRYGVMMNDSEISRYVPMKKCRTRAVQYGFGGLGC